MEKTFDILLIVRLMYFNARISVLIKSKVIVKISVGCADPIPTLTPQECRSKIIERGTEKMIDNAFELHSFKINNRWFSNH